ncbi:Sensor kinase CusS [Methyloligella halotolerans]|uniref:histidine kinase n=1 Tax=Methyloligella halotolerans TaxID=1177755 RepID=A0A1E2RUU3_9HYPH|nr:HAMP domain-containing sensor histidine kinase [Methyloligella halotolerans]ODA66026.1 Sensor kinase CusS [Methyloligella halotolerans]
MKNLCTSISVLLHTSALAIALLLGILGSAGVLAALYLYSRYNRHLNRITSTLTHVAAGDLGARIPITTSSTGLGRTMAEINVMLDRMQLLIQNLNNSSAEIAHTLKHPLIRLRSQLEHASNRGDENIMSILETSVREIDSMLGMVDSMLDIKQIEAGHLRSRFMKTSLKGLVNKLMDVYEPVIQDAGQILNKELTAGDGSILGEPELLFQMLSNLIENAIRYCPAGTTITISLTENGNRTGWIIVIADDGPGMTSDDREQVFTPFFRPEATLGVAGHGMGIPLSAAIAKLHDAQLEIADNEPGLKATISLSTTQRASLPG